MAQKVIATRTDDVDGSEAAETIRFAVDGRDYEIDLSASNAGLFRAALEPWVEHARKPQVPGQPAKGRRGDAPSRTRSHRTAAATVRAWGRANGYELPDRGRISKEIRAAYEAAETAQGAPA